MIEIKDLNSVEGGPILFPMT